MSNIDLSAYSADQLREMQKAIKSKLGQKISETDIEVIQLAQGINALAVTKNVTPQKVISKVRLALGLKIKPREPRQLSERASLLQEGKVLGIKFERTAKTEDIKKAVIAKRKKK